jgi:hypothetical protein
MVLVQIARASKDILLEVLPSRWIEDHHDSLGRAQPNLTSGVL